MVMRRGQHTSRVLDAMRIPQGDAENDIDTEPAAEADIPPII
jgi:hypothetical protein